MPSLTQQQRTRHAERWNTPRRRATKTYPTVPQVHQQPEPEQENNLEKGSVGELLKGCIPTDSKNCLFILITVVYLIIGVIHFGETGDTSMLTQLLYTAGAYVGLPQVKGFLPWGKGRHSPRAPTGE